MSYKVDRARGYQPWAITNPWVFADYGQPQRLRGQVSPLVYKTHGAYLLSNLGQVPTTDPATESLARSRRMEIIAVAGLGVSVTSLLLFSHMMRKNGRRRKVKRNARRRARRTR